ncbi:hypothetical protein GCM10027605_54730 [Micromonospora zhanjiangensis]
MPGFPDAAPDLPDGAPGVLNLATAVGEGDGVTCPVGDGVGLVRSRSAVADTVGVAPARSVVPAGAQPVSRSNPAATVTTIFLIRASTFVGVDSPRKSR